MSKFVKVVQVVVAVQLFQGVPQVMKYHPRNDNHCRMHRVHEPEDLFEEEMDETQQNHQSQAKRKTSKDLKHLKIRLVVALLSPLVVLLPLLHRLPSAS